MASILIFLILRALGQFIPLVYAGIMFDPAKRGDTGIISHSDGTVVALVPVLPVNYLEAPNKTKMAPIF
jgi:hypothetical protein